MIKLSVIIPTKNRCEYLRDALCSMTEQTIASEEYEVIVIDNGSTDNTKAVCEEVGKRFCNFEYYYEATPGLHVGRNLGMQLCKGEILVYADDDILVQPEWLSAIESTFVSMPEVGLVGGNIYPQYEGNVPRWLPALWIDKGEGQILDTYSVVIFNSDDGYIDANFIFGCNFAIRKSILTKAGGFHPDGMPSDLLRFRGDGESHVSNYINLSGVYKAYYCKNASVYHRINEQRLSLEYLDSVSFRQGVSRIFGVLRYKSLYFAIVELLRDIVREEKYSVLNSEINIIRRKKKEIQRGMLFLIIQYCKSKELRRWIHQGDYMDEKGDARKYDS